MNTKIMAAIVVALSSFGAVAAESTSGAATAQNQQRSQTEVQVAGSSVSREQVRREARAAARENGQERIAESYTHYPVLRP